VAADDHTHVEVAVRKHLVVVVADHKQVAVAAADIPLVVGIVDMGMDIAAVVGCSLEALEGEDRLQVLLEGLREEAAVTPQGVVVNLQEEEEVAAGNFQFPGRHCRRVVGANLPAEGVVVSQVQMNRLYH